jgi:hypothetical protein
MNLQRRTKHILFLSVSLACLIAAACLYFLGIVSFYISMGVACVTILAPLICALCVYKGKPAKIFGILAVIGMLFGLVYAVDLVVTLQSFKATCSTQGAGHEFLATSDSYTCTAESEANYLTGYVGTVSQSVFLMYPYFLIILVNIGNTLYLPVRAVWKWRR